MAFVLCLLAIPVSLLVFLFVSQHGVSQRGEAWFYVLSLSFLIEGIALICGIAGRRSVAGKAAAILSGLFLVLGMIGSSVALVSSIHRDFGGWPSAQPLGPSWEMGPDDPVHEFTEY